MLRASVLVFLTIAVFGSLAAFVGKPHYGSNRLHLILGADKCTRGPGYWCQNFSTAHECGTAQHCLTKQWNAMDLPTDHSEPCDLCVRFLSEVENVLKANLTVDVVEGVIDKVCTSVMIPAKVCEKYLDPYIVEIQDAIANNIKPQVTCNLIHFCNNEEGVGKTYERLAKTMAASSETNEKLAAVVDAFKPLGPGMMTGDSESVYGGSTSAKSPLSCTDGQVYWCKSLENANECKQVEHCKKVVWAHQEKSPLPDISSPHADSTATPPTSASPLNFVRFPSTSPLCARGQSFWCSNLTSAASCGATQHCIQAVWTHLKVKQDGDDVCTICKDMVKQARDQLTSNETQNDLKAVFEGSCNLIPIKIVREGCDKLADDFVPELIEVLSSQMNPDVVCSVAGLCNNAAIDRLLLASTATTSTSTRKVATDDNSDCKNCAGFADLLTKKFNRASKQDVFNVFQGFCTEFSSFSDACMKVVDSQSDQWYNGLTTYFTTGMVSNKHLPFSVLNMCRVNKMCTNETIPSLPAISVEVSHKSESGVLSREAQASGESGADLPCSLCGQLVKHLKDILVANTTETEFKQVLEGICKQTGGFSEECTALVAQYYEPLYTFLTSELDPTGICVDVGLCPKKHILMFNNMDILSDMPVVPMHFEPVQTSHLPAHVSSSEDSSEEIHMKGNPVSPQRMIESTTNPACLVCEYILHFVQEQVADTKNSKKIMDAMHEACHQMPGEFSTECEQFVTEYGQAFIALAIQQIDPSQVCPKLRVCTTTAKAPLIFGASDSSQGTCPLCLLAVQAIDEQILNNRTEDNIKHTLDSICSSLPKHLSSDCTKFINVYYDELIDMLVAETTPQEICVYIRLCLPPKQSRTTAVASTPEHGDSQACILCEFVMTKLDNILKDRKTDEQIKHAVHSVCHLMPKTIRQECDDFVNKYSDLIIQLLAQSLSPHDICEALGVCNNSGDDPAPTPKPITPTGECAICEDAMSHLDDALADPAVKDNNIKTALDKVCYHVGKTEFDECNKFILKYGTKILIIVDQTPSYLICNKIKVCPSPKGRLIGFENEHILKHMASPYGDLSKEPITQDVDENEVDCTTVWGYSMCQRQVPLILIGMLMLVSLMVIFVTARTVRRNRLMTRHSGVMHTPYEKLYQPTTIPTHGADDFTSTIVR
uniref:Prosaposin n=1 Tax=Cacopsylla melanoneura TaxID=428564 RepID=A0A8D8XLW1_9HEMI